ncbi:hypothetical protein L5515_009663 [Caenorhabditis briggsae]|uniref:Uncharacterized protein n=1 Tax=Caenorhabditis briggsae TaxID=6238 RepID=A0AAE9FDF3_CAEBR|nr:hypothetical protein L5515_009663 [Caenorhabditis briggsae]
MENGPKAGCDSVEGTVMALNNGGKFIDFSETGIPDKFKYRLLVSTSLALQHEPKHDPFRRFSSISTSSIVLVEVQSQEGITGGDSDGSKRMLNF